MSDTLVHLLYPIGRYDHGLDNILWIITFRCGKPPEQGHTFTTARADVTCADCIAVLEHPPAAYGPKSEQSPGRLY